MLDENGYPFKSKEFSQLVDIYQRNGMLQGIKNYLALEGKLKCPEKVRYWFTEEYRYKLKISDKCCKINKEKPAENWQKENNKPIAIIGLLGDEKGRRSSYGNGGCFIERKSGKDNLYNFYPLRKVDTKFEIEFIKKYNIKLCKLYYPPFNFERTGCKG